LLSFLFALTLAQVPGPLVEVRARWLDAPPHFVGQAIGLEVSTPAENEPLELVLPRVVNAELLITGPAGQQGISDGGGRHTWTIRLIPSRAGPLQVPPFVVKTGTVGRVGRSAPLTSTVRDLPATGRSRAFLGGVGTLLAVDAEAEPDSLRVGRTLEYRLTLTGPGARGSTAMPDLSAFDRLPLGLRVTPLSSEFDEDVSRRVLRFRVRPTVAGEATLPAVAVAFFDPRTQTYQTRLGPKVPIRVIAAPALDPETLDYAPQPAKPGAWWLPWVLSAIVSVGALVGLLIIVRRHLTERRRDPARLIARRARKLITIAGPVVMADRIEHDLADFLALAVGRPPGVLTPDEAAASLSTFLDEDLGHRARELIARCDEVRYGGSPNGVGVSRLRDEAIVLYRSLATGRSANGRGRPANQSGSQSQPREAVL
jgi:hypothetical protein